MEKSLIFLLLVGALIASGIILSFYGAQLTTQDIIVKEETLVPGSSIEVSIDLNPEFSELGVYVVLLEKYVEDSISVSVYDPFGSKFVSKIIEKESTEDRFEIVSSGTYKLELENSGLEEYHIVAGLGYMPNAGTLSIGITGFYLLIIGLIGIVGVGVYSIRNRKKHKLS
ncbi:MAG: hypothetical protein ACE5RN_01895 [Nitrosopumilaceae archaeon]